MMGPAITVFLFGYTFLTVVCISGTTRSAEETIILCAAMSASLLLTFAARKIAERCREYIHNRRENRREEKRFF